MAYSELIKKFERIRDYMRQFYVYGFRSRSDFGVKSLRSYDNERRRIESWLNGYMDFRRDASGKHIFISVDSRDIPGNPLHAAFKTKSFTENDITLHFYILDLLDKGAELGVRDILDGVMRYLSRFPLREILDESTVRKKLKEYEQLGLVESRKQGRELLYRRAVDGVDLEAWKEPVAFYSEEAPLGVIGSYILDKYGERPELFSFKHHYILRVLDSEILRALLEAMHTRRSVELTLRSARTDGELRQGATPLRIYVSTQTGRQYVLAHVSNLGFRFFRLDTIQDVRLGAPVENSEAMEAEVCAYMQHQWGVSNASEATEHIEMDVHVADDEPFIIRRLRRERRCGRIEQLDAHTWRFVADVHNASEMMPWLRTFTGRVVRLECSNPQVLKLWKDDLAALLAMYGENDHAL